VTPKRRSGRGLPERSQEHVKRHVLRDATHCTNITSHLTNFRIERVHDHTDLRKPVPHDRGYRQSVRTGEELVDDQQVRKKLPAKLDALATVLRDPDALQVRFPVDQVAKVLPNQRMALGDQHTHPCHGEDYRRDRASDKVPFGYVGSRPAPDVPEWDLVSSQARTNIRWPMRTSPISPTPVELRSGPVLPARSDSETAPIRVLIGDSDGEFRRLLRVSFAADPSIEVVGEADDGELALQLLRRLRPDVALLDEDMPSFGGAAIARVLRSERSETRVVVLTRPMGATGG